MKKVRTDSAKENPSDFAVRYIDMTEEQESQWVRDFSLLCLEVYEENRQIRPLILDQCVTIPLL